MNWLDIILIILIAICIIISIVICIAWINDYEISSGIASIIVGLIIAGVIASPFIVVDKSSGVTIGRITSVDKNFFGTTALYIKTTENKEEEYCIEYNEELEEIAKNYIGKDVKISYGTRVGLYSTSKCNQAPVEHIELLEN